MSKIKCTVCDTVLESTHRHDFVSCSCDNGSFVDGGNDYMRVGGKDLSKIRIFRESTGKFEEPTI